MAPEGLWSSFFEATAPAEQLSSAYHSFWLYRWELAERELCQELRDEVLLPLDPSDATGTLVFSDVEEAVVLPPWHCSFAGCSATERQLKAGDKHEYNLWRHVWQETASNASHAPLLKKIISKYGLTRTVHPEARHLEEIAFTLLSGALLAKERELCPNVGLATDRRALGHVGEIFREDSVKTLMCYVCACAVLCLYTCVTILNQSFGLGLSFDKINQPNLTKFIDYTKNKT